MLPKAKLTKLILTELAAVPTGAQEAQGTAILKRKDTRPTEIRKQSAMTTATQGHQHLLYFVDETQSGSTSYESSYVEGQPTDYYTGHCHPWIRNEDGTIEIGESLGHTHKVGALSASLAKATPTKNADSAETTANKSTRPDATRSVGLVKENLMADQKPEHDTKIADLEKRLASVTKLTTEEHTVWKSLKGDEAEVFLAKSQPERAAQVTEIAKRNDEAEKVVYVSKSTGDVYKAKDDTRLVEMAKRLDAESEKREAIEIRKAAETLLAKKAPGTDETHDDIVRSIRKSGLSKERIEAMEASLRGLVETSSIGKKAPGFDGGIQTDGGNADDALAKLEKGLVAFCKAQSIKNVWTEGLAAFAKTDEGAALKKAHDESLAG